MPGNIFLNIVNERPFPTFDNPSKAFINVHNANPKKNTEITRGNKYASVGCLVKLI